MATSWWGGPDKWVDTSSTQLVFLHLFKTNLLVLCCTYSTQEESVPQRLYIDVHSAHCDCENEHSAVASKTSTLNAETPKTSTAL